MKEIIGKEFGAKSTELYGGKELPVVAFPKFVAGVEKAREIIKSGLYDVTEKDFWILINFNKEKTKAFYSGLIISHTGCLKINDKLPPEKQFRPSCEHVDKEGYNKSLVFTYICDEQGIYEVGEVNEKNCKNEYPYAMAHKRLFDRVVLKISKLAFSGIYSDSEAEEFSEVNNKTDAPIEPIEDADTPIVQIEEDTDAPSNGQLQMLASLGSSLDMVADFLKIPTFAVTSKSIEQWFKTAPPTQSQIKHIKSLGGNVEVVANTYKVLPNAVTVEMVQTMINRKLAWLEKQKQKELSENVPENK